MRRHQIEIFGKRFPHYEEVRWDQCLLWIGPIKIYRTVLEVDHRVAKRPWVVVILWRVAAVWLMVWLLSLALKRGG